LDADGHAGIEPTSHSDDAVHVDDHRQVAGNRQVVGDAGDGDSSPHRNVEEDRVVELHADDRTARDLPAGHTLAALPPPTARRARVRQPAIAGVSLVDAPSQQHRIGACDRENRCGLQV